MYWNDPVDMEKLLVNILDIMFVTIISGSLKKLIGPIEFFTISINLSIRADLNVHFYTQI